MREVSREVTREVAMRVAVGRQVVVRMAVGKEAVARVAVRVAVGREVAGIEEVAAGRAAAADPALWLARKVVGRSGVATVGREAGERVRGDVVARAMGRCRRGQWRRKRQAH